MHHDWIASPMLCSGNGKGAAAAHDSSVTCCHVACINVRAPATVSWWQRDPRRKSASRNIFIWISLIEVDLEMNTPLVCLMSPWFLSHNMMLREVVDLWWPHGYCLQASLGSLLANVPLGMRGRGNGNFSWYGALPVLPLIPGPNCSHLCSTGPVGWSSLTAPGHLVLSVP